MSLEALAAAAHLETTQPNFDLLNSQTTAKLEQAITESQVNSTLQEQLANLPTRKQSQLVANGSLFGKVFEGIGAIGTLEYGADKVNQYMRFMEEQSRMPTRAENVRTWSGSSSSSQYRLNLNNQPQRYQPQYQPRNYNFTDRNGTTHTILRSGYGG